MSEKCKCGHVKDMHVITQASTTTCQAKKCRCIVFSPFESEVEKTVRVAKRSGITLKTEGETSRENVEKYYFETDKLRKEADIRNNPRSWYMEAQKKRIEEMTKDEEYKKKVKESIDYFRQEIEAKKDE